MPRRLATTPLGLGLECALVALAAACAHGPSAKERESAEIHYNLGTDALRNGRVQELNLKKPGEMNFILQQNDTITVPEKNWMGQ